MLINNTHIQGIFKYSSSIEFEEGDLIMSGSYLYICTAEYPTNKENNTVQGQSPEDHPENFRVYLGDKIIEVQEYLNYVEGLETEDKYISSRVLSGILNHYLFGVSERGIIKDYVSYDPKNKSYGFSQDLSDLISGENFNDGVLGIILKEESLNNALVSISTSLPEIINIYGEEITKQDQVILRQYTYYKDYNTLDCLYRLQELINPVSGIIKYRVTLEGGDFTKVSNWASSFYDENSKKDLDNLSNYYNNKLKTIPTPTDNFQFKEIKIPSNSSEIELQCINSKKSGYINVKNFSIKQADTGNAIVDITVRFKASVDDFIWKNLSTTIDLRDSSYDNPRIIEKYLLTFGIYLVLTPIDLTTIKLSLESALYTDLKFSSIYCRNYY